MKKIGMLTSVLLLVAMVICGCSASKMEEDADVTTMCIYEDGSLTVTFVEDFSQSYYDQDELKKMAEDEVAEFNEAAGTEKIRIDSFEVLEQTAKMKMYFADSKAYASYQGEDLFVGTIDEAKLSGYSFDVSLVKAADETVTIGESDITAMGEDMVVIAQRANRIRTEKKISYYSNEAKYIGKYEIDAYENSDETIVIFK